MLYMLKIVVRLPGDLPPEKLAEINKRETARSMQMVREGKLTGFAVTRRSPMLPDVPTSGGAALTSSVTSAAVQIDNAVPGVSMSSGAAATTNANPIPVTVTFTE